MIVGVVTLKIYIYYFEPRILEMWCFLNIQKKISIFWWLFSKKFEFATKKFQFFAILQNFTHKKDNVYVVKMLPIFQNPQIQLCIDSFIFIITFKWM